VQGGEVLFTLLAERYERGSVLLTSNLAFSKWDQIFKDAMTTAAAIDHSRRDRPAGPPQRHHRNERPQLPRGNSEEHQNKAFTVTNFQEPDRNSNCR